MPTIGWFEILIVVGIAIFGTGKFYKEKQEEKKEDIYSNIDEMLNSTLDTEEKD